MTARKILLTGATGYIGGSILTRLAESGLVEKNEVTVLVRGTDKAQALESKFGVKTIQFKSLDESELLRRIAGDNDVVIHTASGYHTGAAKALLLGLGDRRKSTDNKLHYIHTSGTSDLGDQPISGKYFETRVLSDKEDIFSYLKGREAKQIYSQRTTSIAVIETGIEVNVPTTILMSPTIYGTGSGLFNTLSIQEPAVARLGLKDGQVSVIGDGNGVWDYVHIADLADLYNIVIGRVLDGEQVVSGKKGIIFTGTGRFQWKDISIGVADALHDAGAIKTKELKSVSLEEAAPAWAGGSLLTVELAYASNSKTEADIAKEYGWEPKKTDADFKKHFADDVKSILAAAEKK